MYKLFCISKTTIKINCSDQSLHCIRCYRFSLSSSGSIFSFTKQKVFAKIRSLAQNASAGSHTILALVFVKFPFRKLRIIVKQGAGHQFKDRIPHEIPKTFITSSLWQMRTDWHKSCESSPL